MTGVNSSDNVSYKNPNGTTTLYGIVNNQKTGLMTPNLALYKQNSGPASECNEYNPEANHKRQVKSGLGKGEFAYGDNSFDNSGQNSTS